MRQRNKSIWSLTLSSRGCIWTVSDLLGLMMLMRRIELCRFCRISLCLSRRESSPWFWGLEWRLCDLRSRWSTESVYRILCSWWTKCRNFLTWPWSWFRISACWFCWSVRWFSLRCWRCGLFGYQYHNKRTCHLHQRISWALMLRYSRYTGYRSLIIDPRSSRDAKRRHLFTLHPRSR